MPLGPTRMRISLSLAITSALLLVGLSSGCDSSDEPVDFRSVDPVCVEDAPPAEEWTCGEVYSTTCEDAASADISLHVELAAGQCAGADLQSVDGPFEPGTHEIEIDDAASGTTVCTATLEITDDAAPEVETVGIGLWPPNHKYHEITLDDCIDEIVECDPNWEARIIAVSSDEPIDTTGDGHTEADIVVVDAQTVSLRSERRGNSNGRVYNIDFEVEDGSGNIGAATCRVAVVHDQSGASAIDDGPAYTVDWPAP